MAESEAFAAELSAETKHPDRESLSEQVIEDGFKYFLTQFDEDSARKMMTASGYSEDFTDRQIADACCEMGKTYIENGETQTGLQILEKSGSEEAEDLIRYYSAEETDPAAKR